MGDYTAFSQAIGHEAHYYLIKPLYMTHRTFRSLEHKVWFVVNNFSGSCLSRGKSDKTIGPPVSFTIENARTWDRPCYG